MRLSNSPQSSSNNSLPPPGKQVGEKMFMLEESKGRSDKGQQKRETQLTFMDEILKILIVDDDEVDRLSIKRAIKEPTRSAVSTRTMLWTESL